MGAGNLGGAVIKSLVSRKIYSKKEIYVITATEASAQRWRKWGVRSGAGNYAVISHARELWLAIKPHQIKEMAKALAPLLGKKTSIISLLAGWSPSRLAKLLGTEQVLSVMTNTAARVDAGLYVIFHGLKPMGATRRAGLRRRFQKLGYFGGFFAESRMPEITALVGSAPAFLLDLQRQYEAYALASGVSLSVARGWYIALHRSCEELVATQSKLDTLIAQIATPGGCTERGLSVLGSQKSLAQALEHCAARAKELGG